MILENVTDQAGNAIYDAENSRSDAVTTETLGFETNGDEKDGNIIVEWLTPLRISIKGRPLRNIDFSSVFRSLMRRSAAMFTYHESAPLPYDPNELVRLSDEAKTVLDNTRWYDWKRYSSRQDKDVPLGGVLGVVEYRNVRSELRPWLNIAERIHVGKGCTVGLGKPAVRRRATLDA